MNALQELIRSHCRETNESMADIAKRAGLSRQTISAIVHRDDPGAIPHRSTLRKLAVGLELRLEIVERAALMAASQTDGDELTELRLDVLLDTAQDLTDAQINVLVAAARAMKRG